MIRFNCDYAEGAHDKIMQLMLDSNKEQTEGYGCDHYCEEARKLIKKACGKDDAYVQFLVGGTQTNMTVIASVLRPFQGVLCADTGHINVHETGAIESTGHKVLALKNTDAKITAAQIDKYCEEHFNNESAEHIVQPGMVYISQSTELGTTYNKAELTQIAEVCKKWKLPLFVDGARLAYGLMAEDCDVTLEDLAELADVFYIGGTKVGALFGEAVVITNPSIAKDFRYMIKQRGGMLAKGRLLGIQFLGLLQDDLYWELGKHADQLADQVRDAFAQKGCDFLAANRTNQVFVILADTDLDKLKEKYSFSYECRINETHSAVRFCTSWATTQEQVDSLCADIAQL